MHMYKMHYKIVSQTDMISGATNHNIHHIHDAHISQLPRIDSRNCISILISSDFLKMEKLVQESLVYISNHLNEIVKIPMDLKCLQDRIIKMIA